MSNIRKSHQVHGEKIAGDRFAEVGDTGTACSRHALQPASEIKHTTEHPSTYRDASREASSKRFHYIEDIVVGKDSTVMFTSTLGEVFNAKRVTAVDRFMLTHNSAACVRNF